jgi:hypothetical protein
VNARLATLSTVRYALGLDAIEDMGKAGTLPKDYVEVVVYRRVGAEIRACGETERGGWRVNARVVAEKVKNAQRLQECVADALEYVRLTVSGEKTTPLKLETDAGIGPDDGSWSGLTAWTYAL